MKFDPMTGKPIVGAGKKRSTKGIKIAAVLAVVVVEHGVIVKQDAPRIILAKKYKIVQPFLNTFKPNHLMDNLNCSDILDGEYTVSGNGVAGDVSVMDVVLGVDSSEKKISLEGRLCYGDFGTRVCAFMDSKKVLVGFPELYRDPLKYSYAEEKDGYLIEWLEN